MDLIDKVFLQNKAWVAERTGAAAKHFYKLSEEQHPDFFWIECSDSQVPANEITNTRSGQIFVHRNIANMVVNTDMNLLSDLQYATEVLKVKHIIVCGHYGCRGIKAALGNKHLGLLNKWVRNIKDVYRLHRDEIDALENEEVKWNRLVEVNIIEQVHNLSKTSIVQKARKEKGYPYLHGWVYHLNDGLLQNLITIKPNDEIDPIYRFDSFDEK